MRKRCRELAQQRNTIYVGKLPSLLPQVELSAFALCTDTSAMAALQYERYDRGGLQHDDDQDSSDIPPVLAPQ